MLKEQTALSDLIAHCTTLCNEIEDARILLEMAHEEGDRETEADVGRQLAGFAARLSVRAPGISVSGRAAPLRDRRRSAPRAAAIRLAVSVVQEKP